MDNQKIPTIPYANISAIYGDDGTILKKNRMPELEIAYLKSPEEGMAAGYAVLEGYGTSLRAVKATIVGKLGSCMKKGMIGDAACY